MIKEFSEFIKKGNVMDLAVGVIIGSSFSKIVNSLVDNIIMPIVGIFIGGVDFSSLSITVKEATINYGLFIQNVVDFLITAFCIFLMLKVLNKLKEEADKNIKKAEKIVENTKIVKEIKTKTSKKKKKN